MSLNIELLEQSFALVKNRGDEFADRFYATLFTDYPSVKPLFANTRIEVQGKKLFDSLVFVVENLRNPADLDNALRGLGTRHVKYGALPQHYPAVGGTLLATFEWALGDRWTPELQQAWADAYGAVTTIMLAGADYPPEILKLPT
jgi:nitric oxide dioxygenase